MAVPMGVPDGVDGCPSYFVANFTTVQRALSISFCSGPAPPTTPGRLTTSGESMAPAVAHFAPAEWATPSPNLVWVVAAARWLCELDRRRNALHHGPMGWSGLTARSGQVYQPDAIPTPAVLLRHAILVSCGCTNGRVRRVCAEPETVAGGEHSTDALRVVIVWTRWRKHQPLSYADASGWPSQSACS